MAIESKDSIRRRMIRNASQIWGFQDTEDINSFDPIVSMLLGALAEELNSLSVEIQKTDARVVEKLLDLLFNQNIHTHFPAHGLVKAQPIQASTTISELNQFSIKKSIETNDPATARKKESSIYFTPTVSMKLFKGEVKVILSRDKVIADTDQQLSGLQPEKGLGSSTIYIGLSLDQRIESLDGLQLHFSIVNKDQKDVFYHLLSSAEWKISNQPVVFKNGYPEDSESSETPLASLIREESDISFRTCRFVTELYSQKSMILDNKGYTLENFKGEHSVPDEFRKVFSTELLDALGEKLFWVELSLPHPVSKEFLRDLEVSMNCFPVINRRRNEFTQALRKGSNVIPILTEDAFFDIRQVTNSRGNHYYPASGVSNEAKDDNTYVIRQNGVGRFNSSDAIETINQLTDLVRNESAAFTALGTDMISSELRELDQIITRLKQRIQTNRNNGNTQSYLILNSLSAQERAHIEYWSTNGELANGIRSGSRMLVSGASDIDSKSLLLMTNTSGGRQKLSIDDKVNKLRSTILSKGRIVTKEDIKALCYEHFGEGLHRIKIVKGAHIDESTESGLVRCLEIHLEFARNNQLSEENTSQMVEELLVKLKQRSINLMPFKVIVSEN